MPILPAKESRHYKMACHWNKDAEMHRDYVARRPGMAIEVQTVYLQLADILEQQATDIFNAIEKYGPNAVVIE